MDVIPGDAMRAIAAAVVDVRALACVCVTINQHICDTNELKICVQLYRDGKIGRELYDMIAPNIYKYLRRVTHFRVSDFIVAGNLPMVIHILGDDIVHFTVDVENNEVVFQYYYSRGIFPVDAITHAKHLFDHIDTHGYDDEIVSGFISRGGVSCRDIIALLNCFHQKMSTSVLLCGCVSVVDYWNNVDPLVELAGKDDRVVDILREHDHECTDNHNFIQLCTFVRNIETDPNDLSWLQTLDDQTAGKISLMQCRFCHWNLEWFTRLADHGRMVNRGVLTRIIRNLRIGAVKPTAAEIEPILSRNFPAWAQLELVYLAAK